MDAKKVFWMGRYWWQCGDCLSKRTRREPAERCCTETGKKNGLDDECRGPTGRHLWSQPSDAVSTCFWCLQVR